MIRLTAGRPSRCNTLQRSSGASPMCVGNVVGRPDRRGNLFPTKQRDGKIDTAVALLVAIGRAQASEGDGAEDITAFLLNPVMG